MIFGQFYVIKYISPTETHIFLTFVFKIVFLLSLKTERHFLPARRYASAGLCESNVSVRLFVRLSVTRRYCVKTKKASVMISSISGSPMILVF